MPAPPLRRLAFGLGGAILAAVVVVGGLILAFLFNFNHLAPTASYPAPKSALEAQRQDLDYFAKAMAFDRAFSPAARAAAEARVSALKALPEALPPAKLQVALMQVMASADNGHSRMDPTADQTTLILPLRVTRFAEGFYVMRAAAPYRDLLGGRVDSIDGRAIDQILPRLETLRGGVEGLRRENAAQFVVVQDLLYGLGITTDPKASTWTVTLTDGRVVTRRLEADPLRKGQDLPESDRWLSPEPVKGMEKEWIAYRPQSGDLPETWRDFDNHFRLFPAASSCAQVVRLQSIADTDGQNVAPFLATTEAALRANPLTSSAAITTAAFVKDAGGDRVTIIGEPIGDRLSFYSEGGKACLPNLKVCMYFQTAKHDYGHACNDWHKCFWVNWLYPVRVKSLQPDIVLPLKFADWNAGRDEAYLTARDLAEGLPIPDSQMN